MLSALNYTLFCLMLWLNTFSVYWPVEIDQKICLICQNDLTHFIGEPAKSIVSIQMIRY